MDQSVDQRRLGEVVVPGDEGLARVVVVVRARAPPRRASGTTRRTRRMAAINWVTVSWVATASSSSVESRARRCLPRKHPGRVDDRAHRLEDPFGALGLAQSRAPIREHRVVKARLVEGQPAGHLPADPVGQRPSGLAIRESLEGLEDHDRGHRVGRDRGPTALGGEEVLEHRVGEEVVAMIGEERLDAPLGHESATERRRVEQFTIGFAESLHRSILDDHNRRTRHHEPIYSTVS